VALAAVAELQREMGRVFSSDSYYLESIKAYRFLMKQYPQNRVSRDALFVVGVIYLSDLEDPDEAGKVFHEFIRTYPKSDKAGEAQEKVKQIDRLAAERAKAHSAPHPSGTVAEARGEAALRQAHGSTSLTVPEQSRREGGEQTGTVGRPSVPPPSEGAAEQGPPGPPAGRSADHPQLAGAPSAGGGPPQVTAVRRWVAPSYSRIVIGVEGEVKFDSARLANPDRIVLDLQNSRLSPELVGKKFPVEDGFLRQIRLAQFSPDVTRVVLDVEKIENYSVFTLPNPFRLVIDIQGAPPPMPKAVRPVTPTSSGSKGDVARRPYEPAVPEGTATKSQPPPPVQAKTEESASVPAARGNRDLGVGSSEASSSQLPNPNSPLPPGTTGSEKKEKSETLAETSTPTIRPAAPTESGSRTLTRALGLKIGRIVIDPGHGGHDTGTIGPTGLEEKDVVLDVSLKLKKLLEQNTGCEVIMTRSDDTFIPLEERTAIANEKRADLFISIHANASNDKRARGIETYYLNLTSSPDALEVVARENATSQEAVHQLQDLIRKIAMTEKIEESQDFARQVQRQVYTRVTKLSGAQRDRGIKKAPFVVLIGANMPSVLAEISFLTNPRDERLLKRSDYREKIANALYEGIVGYVRSLGEIQAAQRVASDLSAPASQTSPATHPHF
jgi:N-acetylmuramoyl-L-alanine amidase